MLVELRSGGYQLAVTELPGQLITAPVGATAHLSDRERCVVDFSRVVPDAPDRIVGDVPLLYRHNESHRVSVKTVAIAPPPPVSRDDLMAMWSDVQSAGLGHAALIPGQGRSVGAATDYQSGLDQLQLPEAASAVRSLLSRWPTLEATETLWRPFEVRGGREDALTTERRGGSMLGRADGRRRLPERTARRVRGSIAWRSGRMSEACSELAQALRAGAPQGMDLDRSSLVALFSRCARKAGCTNTRKREPAMSSWPPVARTAYRHVIRALSSVLAAHDGSSPVPMSDFWRLYENWITCRTEDSLIRHLGAGTLPGNQAGRRQWTLNGGTTLLLATQWTFGRELRSPLQHSSYRSITSELRPDVCLFFDRPSAGQALICIDAKQRTSLTAMELASIAAEGSKYSWGIRTGGRSADIATTSVILASSAPVPAVFDTDMARIAAVHVTPSLGAKAFDELLFAALGLAAQTLG